MFIHTFIGHSSRDGIRKEYVTPSLEVLERMFSLDKTTGEITIKDSKLADKVKVVKGNFQNSIGLVDKYGEVQHYAVDKIVFRMTRRSNVSLSSGYVRHLDGDRFNDNPDNLEFVHFNATPQRFIHRYGNDYVLVFQVKVNGSFYFIESGKSKSFEEMIAKRNKELAGRNLLGSVGDLVYSGFEYAMIKEEIAKIQAEIIMRECLVDYKFFRVRPSNGKYVLITVEFGTPVILSEEFTTVKELKAYLEEIKEMA